MDPITVSTTPTAAAPPPPPAAAAAIDNSAELAALKAENAEVKRAAEFWQSRATTQPSAPPPPAAEPEPKRAPVDILDLLATQGEDGFDAYMKARGYVSQKEVDATVQATVNAKGQQLSTEAELLSNYPDLKNKESDFFKATAQNYGELKQQGVPEAMAMKLGAQQAELQGFRSGKVKTPTQIASDTAATKEANRLARIKAQGGEKTTRTPEGIGDEDDNELSAHEKHICVAMGISEESYIARAKKGVQMGGLGKK